MPGPMMRAEQWGTWSVSFQAGAAVAVSNFPASFQISNFPATQPVSGTIAISNASLAVTQSGAWSVALTGTPTVNVGNLPATQAVSGSVSVSNFPTVQAASQSGNWAVAQAGTWTMQAVQSGNWAVGVTSLPALPAGANAIGTVSVSNFPASQAVTGTFWQATQPVSIAAPVGVIQQPAQASGAITPRTTTNVSGFVASAVACNFFGATVIGHPNGVGAYVLALNRTTIPASGAAITQGEIYAMTGFTAGGGANLIPDQVPDRYGVGCVLVCSTSTTTYTPLTTNLPLFIKARVA